MSPSSRPTLVSRPAQSAGACMHARGGTACPSAATTNRCCSCLPLSCTLRPPDEYKATPASRVESGEALLAIAPSGEGARLGAQRQALGGTCMLWRTVDALLPTPCLPALRRGLRAESVISYATWPEAHKQRPKLRAVAAVLQADTSAVVTLQSSGIDRPAKVCVWGGATAAGAEQRQEGSSSLAAAPQLYTAPREPIQTACCATCSSAARRQALRVVCRSLRGPHRAADDQSRRRQVRCVSQPCVL